MVQRNMKAKWQAASLSSTWAVAVLLVPSLTICMVQAHTPAYRAALQGSDFMLHRTKYRSVLPLRHDNANLNRP